MNSFAEVFCIQIVSTIKKNLEKKMLAAVASHMAKRIQKLQYLTRTGKQIPHIITRGSIAIKSFVKMLLLLLGSGRS